jgi:hypothetical protein
MKPRTIKLVGMSNEVGDVSRLVMKYGAYPHPKAVQIFDHETALVLANDLVARRRGDEPFGAKFYIGHPDVAELAQKFPDKRAYGWIEEIIPQLEQAVFLVNWSEEGRQAIEARHFGWWSPYFKGVLKKDGTRQIAQLVTLYSAGLTNTPNSYALRLPNEAGDESPEGETTMPLLQRILALFGASDMTTEDEAVSLVQRAIDMGCKLKEVVNGLWKSAAEADQTLAQMANDAADEDRLAALVNSLATRLQAATTDLANERAGVADLSGLVTALRTEKDQALADLANERTARTAAESAMNVAADSGRRALADLANERRERVTADGGRGHQRRAAGEGQARCPHHGDPGRRCGGRPRCAGE